jgi:hypothetical protein
VSRIIQIVIKRKGSTMLRDESRYNIEGLEIQEDNSILNRAIMHYEGRVHHLLG